jgi:hypothetical protein
MAALTSDHSNKDFDVRGVRDAFLECLHCVRKRHPNWTLTQCLVALEAIVAEERGEPHTVISLAQTLNAPYSTISRVILSLIQGEDSVLMHRPHPTDMRKKHVVGDPDKLLMNNGQLLRETMLRYYGDSVFELKRRPDRA